MDFHFNTMKENIITILESNNQNIHPETISKPIIKFGREGFIENDIEVSSGTSISRRHCVIINSKDNVWLYDLESTGTYLNNDEVNNKTPLIGYNKLTINKIDFTITTDKNKLL